MCLGSGAHPGHRVLFILIGILSSQLIVREQKSRRFFPAGWPERKELKIFVDIKLERPSCFPGWWRQNKDYLPGTEDIYLLFLMEELLCGKKVFFVCG